MQTGADTQWVTNITVSDHHIGSYAGQGKGGGGGWRQAFSSLEYNLSKFIEFYFFPSHL